MLIGRDRDWESSYRDRWSHDKVVRSTHGVNRTVLLVERVRQGRHHHLGDAGRRLSVNRPRHAQPRAARTPARRFVFLVHVLADPAQVPVHPRQPARDVPRAAHKDRRPGRRLGADRRGPRAFTDVQVAARQGGFVRASWNEAAEIVAAATVYTIKQYGPDRIYGFTSATGDVAGLVRFGQPFHQLDRRIAAELLRLVCGLAAGLAADLR